MVRLAWANFVHLLTIFQGFVIFLHGRGSKNHSKHIFTLNFCFLIPIRIGQKSGEFYTDSDLVIFLLWKPGSRKFTIKAKKLPGV